MVDSPWNIVIEGLEDILERDLLKHQGLLAQTKVELLAYKEGRLHSIAKRNHYEGLVGGGKFNDQALRKAIQGIDINKRHMEDKIYAAKEKGAHHQLIIDTLTTKLVEQRKGLKALADYRRDHGTDD